MSNLKKKTNREIIDGYDYLSIAASSTDFTGLIPSLQENEGELEAYNDIYQFRPRALAQKENENGSDN